MLKLSAPTKLLLTVLSLGICNCGLDVDQLINRLRDPNDDLSGFHE